MLLPPKLSCHEHVRHGSVTGFMVGCEEFIEESVISFVISMFPNKVNRVKRASNQICTPLHIYRCMKMTLLD